MRLDDVLDDDVPDADRLKNGGPGGERDEAGDNSVAPPKVLHSHAMAGAADYDPLGQDRAQDEEQDDEKDDAQAPGVVPAAPASARFFGVPVGALWAVLPTANRALVLSGGLCLLLAAGRLIEPSVAEAAGKAIHPYTAAGRGENCLAHLGALHRALGMYAADNDDLYPPLDYMRPAAKSPAAGDKEGERVTWVSLIRPQAGANTLQCPSGPAIDRRGEVSSYALNPVLSLASVKNVDGPGQTLLLADAGTKHDLSLLPPYPSWPSFVLRGKSFAATDAAGTACNLALRHGGSASAVYADGHADLLAGGDWESEAGAWGGSAVFRRSLARLAGQSGLAGVLVQRLKAGEIGPAADLLRAHRRELQPILDGVAALWLLNLGESASDGVAAAGWNLARAARMAGDNSVETRLNDEESRRCQSELERTRQSERELKTTSWDISYNVPVGWTLEEEIDGRYKRAYLRSALKQDVYVLVEVGEHRSYRTPGPVDWHGMEAGLRARSRSNGYKRISMTGGELNGQPAGLWEFEVEQAGEPRLRKRYLGYSDSRYSHVVACVAPAREFAMWNSVFEQLE